MRALIQRVSEASVSIDGELVGAVGKGMVVLFGVKDGDSEAELDYVAGKCVNLRIFPDAAGKMNLSLLDVGGEALVISQFTLYGDCRKGRRPGFDLAARPELAEPLYEAFVERFKALGVKKVATGRFGADMQVRIFNDGPVTFLVEGANG